MNTSQKSTGSGIVEFEFPIDPPKRDADRKGSAEQRRKAPNGNNGGRKR